MHLTMHLTVATFSSRFASCFFSHVICFGLMSIIAQKLLRIRFRFSTLRAFNLQSSSGVDDDLACSQTVFTCFVHCGSGSVIVAGIAY